MEQWHAIEKFAQSGGARAAGVSQFCSGAFRALDAGNITLRPVLNQVGWHVGQGADPQGVVSLAASRKDVTVMAYSPLAEASPELLHGEPYLGIASTHNVTTAQVALRWLAQRRVPYAVAASRPDYQAENLDVFSFSLTSEEMLQLDTASKPQGCPFWPGSACWKSSSCV